MKKLSEFLSKNKRSIGSILLAGLLAFTFNYSPLKILATNSRNAVAYKSSNISSSSYYTSSSTSSNSLQANYPDGFAEYFEDGGATFNFRNYYDAQFEKVYSTYLNSYIATQTTYQAKLDEFLEDNEVDSLLEYYKDHFNSSSSNINANNFIEFAEYFVTHVWQWTKNGTPKSIDPMINDADSHKAESNLYRNLIMFISGEAYSFDDSDGKLDGLGNEESFNHVNSKSYLKFKSLVDNKIAETFAVYTHDGKTQDKTIGAIIANDSPVSLAYYYAKNARNTDYIYTSSTEPNVTYVLNEAETGNQVYEIGENLTQAEFETNFLKYRIVTPADADYNSSKTLFYKYASTNENPYSKSLSRGIINVFVKDDSVTDEETATYGSLSYTAISSTELAENSKLYVNIPYSDSLKQYFEYLYSTTDSQKFNNFVELFTNGTESLLYFKFNTVDNNYVYIEESQMSAFLAAYPNYEYKNFIKTFNVSDPEYNADDFNLVENSTTPTYYLRQSKNSPDVIDTETYKIYFEKSKVYYTSPKTDDSAYEMDGTNFVYETKRIANVTFENVTIPTAAYELDGENKVIYVLNEDSTTLNVNGVVYPTVKQADLETRNLFVKLPDSIASNLNGDENSYEFYYKHTTESQKQIYVLDNAENAENNEVYKNLYYKVLTKTTYDENPSNYVAIANTDANYNSNFTLYYKYNTSVADTDRFVQNLISNKNAIYIKIDSPSDINKEDYKNAGITYVNSSTFNAESNMYVEISKDDPIFSNNLYSSYTTLYYKYQTESQEKIVYIYSSTSSSSSNSNYQTFTDNNNSEFVAEDYVLIEPGEANYVEGTKLYYKRIRKDNQTVVTPQNAYYYLGTKSTTTLSANSYYLLSFYVYTNGEYGDGTKMQASVYVEDSNGYLTNVKAEHLSTEGTWKQYNIFIATDSLLSSTINMRFYMGDNQSILGTADSSLTTVSGTVLFDNIKLTLINQTDFNKTSLDEKAIYSTTLKDQDGNDIVGKYADSYNNEVIVAGSFNSKVTNDVKLWNNKTWNEMFNVDNLDLSSLTFIDGTDGYTDYNEMWQFYIGRDVSGQGHNYELQQYQAAYNNSNRKVNVSVINEETIFDDKSSNDSTEESSNATTDTDDVSYVKSTFNDNNKILKIENKDKLIPLGITSNTITIEQQAYYKLTVWVYSTDKDAKATIILNSVLYTNGKHILGTNLQTKAEVNANIKGYTSTPTNEYGWIPISFYIEGNALHNQNVTLALLASKSSTVYFDNISIERITSTVYDNANNDSDLTTYAISLSPSSSAITNGISNGYFNNVTVTTNYKNAIDFETPRTAENWSAETGNSADVVAGVVPTSDDYISVYDSSDPNSPNTFYSKNGISTEKFENLVNNVFVIYSPETISSEIAKGKANYTTSNIYKMYSNSISLSASSVYEISFDAYADKDFKGTIFANLYYSSVTEANKIATISIDLEKVSSLRDWENYKFYVATGSTTIGVYLELGVSNASGAVFFKNVQSTTSSKTINQIRDNMFPTHSTSTNVDIYSNELFNNVRFINFENATLSIHSDIIDESSNTYSSSEFKNELKNTSTYTVGKAGVAIASYYDLEVENSYTVTIDKVEYYLKAIENEDTHEITYKLYSDSIYKNEVTKIDNKTVTIPNEKKVIVGTTTTQKEYETTEVKTTSYQYTFTNDVSLNNNVIPAAELNNDYSQNVLVLSNGMTTDYVSITPARTQSLSTGSYYTLKIYVKTSDFEENNGLNIVVSGIQVDGKDTQWNNINTTNSEKADSNGFVCYEVLIRTNTTSVSGFGVTFSLGSSDNTTTGYAIIAGTELKKYSTEKLFTEYSSLFDENDKTVLRFTGVSNSSTDNDTTTKDPDPNNWTATFFYIFSSILLFVVLVMALVAIILKRHKKKAPVEVVNEHERNSTKNLKSGKKSVIEVDEQKPAKTEPQPSNKNDDKNGFV